MYMYIYFDYLLFPLKAPCPGKWGIARKVAAPRRKNKKFYEELYFVYYYSFSFQNSVQNLELLDKYFWMKQIMHWDFLCDQVI